MFDDINEYLLDAPLAAIRGYLEAKLNTQSERLQQAFLIYVENLSTEERQETFDLAAETIQSVDSCYDEQEHAALIRGLLNAVDPSWSALLDETVQNQLIPRESVVRLLSHRLAMWYSSLRASSAPVVQPISPHLRPQNSPSPLSLANNSIDPQCDVVPENVIHQEQCQVVPIESPPGGMMISCEARTACSNLLSNTGITETSESVSENESDFIVNNASESPPDSQQ